MAGIEHPYAKSERAVAAQQPERAQTGWMRTWWFRLLALLFFTELIVPFLLWQAGLPRTADFFKEIVAGAIILLTLAYVMVNDRIPGGLLFVLGLTLIWGINAMMDGQGFGATAWGWWRTFKYPLLLIFAYSVPRWPKHFAQWLIRFIVLILVFEVGFQLIQYAMGQPVGDSLAGTFGWKGVAQFTMFVFFAVCIALGHWVATGKWQLLLLVLVLGTVGSMLNVTKFYLFALVPLGIAGLALHMIRGGQFRQLFVYMALAVLGVVALVPIYNNFIANTRGLKPLQEYIQPETIETYLFNDGKGDVDGRYNLGRGLSITYAWQQIRRDGATTLFGYGLGSRTTSTALGLSGQSALQDLYGDLDETGLGTFIQEYGVVGVTLFLLFNFWIIFKFLRFARHTTDPYQASLAYGLILFTFFWPLWLWYHRPWTAGVMMILYWISLGYVFRQMYKQRPGDREEHSSLSPIP